jgi:hypothetical protein
MTQAEKIESAVLTRTQIEWLQNKIQLFNGY